MIGPGKDHGRMQMWAWEAVEAEEEAYLFWAATADADQPTETQSANRRWAMCAAAAEESAYLHWARAECVAA